MGCTGASTVPEDPPLYFPRYFLGMPSESKSQVSPTVTRKLTDGAQNMGWLLRPGQRGRRYRTGTKLERVYHGLIDRLALWDPTRSMSEGRPTVDFTETWCRLVSEYIACNFTQKADRAPAMIGMVSQISWVTGLTFSLGLWHSGKFSDKCSMHQLMGIVTQPRERPNSCRALSWSWLAVDGPVWHLATGNSSLLEAKNGLGPSHWKIVSRITGGMPSILNRVTQNLAHQIVSL